MELTEENLRNAFSRVIALSGVRVDEDSLDELMSVRIGDSDPAASQKDYPVRLLNVACEVCSEKPYNWNVREIIPEVYYTTTFGSLYENWFKQIIKIYIDHGQRLI